MTAFDRAFKVVIGEEGGYSDNPRDPGGETKYGISKRAYPDVNIAFLTLDNAKAIYKRDYWDKCRCDDLPPSLALVTFDASVNNGPGQAVRWLQGALGVAADGDIGPATMAAVDAHKGKGVALIAECLAQRTLFMADLPTWRVFGLGWARRLARLPFAAVAMDQGDVA